MFLCFDFCCFCVLIFSLTTKNDPLFYLLTQLPLVFSASYTDYELHVNAAYSARVNVELMKVGLRGTSLFMASGDYGIGTQYVKGESSIRVDVDTACNTLVILLVILLVTSRIKTWNMLF